MIKLKNPMPLCLIKGDTITINKETYTVTLVHYDEYEMTTHIEAIKVSPWVRYELGGFIEDEL